LIRSNEPITKPHFLCREIGVLVSVLEVDMVKKNFSKTGRTCRVTFDLPAHVEARKAFLCGEFNDWSPKTHRMEHRKDGRFSVTVTLEAGRPYRFKYLLDGSRWENDWAADAYVPNQFGSEDSLVKV
jgi:1,4-alpha-glucan branching enzyme